MHVCTATEGLGNVALSDNPKKDYKRAKIQLEYQVKL